MIFRDEFHRIVAQFDKHGFVLFGWFVKFGFDNEFVNRQKKCYRCVDCGNFVPSPCHREGEEALWMEEGEWSFWCHDIHYPSF